MCIQIIKKLSINYQFKIHEKNENKRYFQHNWLTKYNWLTYSENYNRWWFCIPCIFSHKETHNLTEILVYSPMIEFKKSTE